MPEDDLVQGSKILAFDLSDLPTNELGEAIIHCPNIDDLEDALLIYDISDKSIVCSSDKLIGLDTPLINHPVDTIYILNVNNDNEFKEWSYCLPANRIIEIQNKTQLMRHLCTKTMLYYYNQGLQYKKRGDQGLANLYFQDSLKALHFSEKFN